MKIWKTTLLYLVAFLIQGSLLNLFAIAGKTPNLLLALTVAIAFLHEEKPYALVFGAVFGFLSDLCFSTYIGPTGIMLTIVAALIYVVDIIAPKENAIIFLAVAAPAVLFFYAGEWLLIRLAGNPSGIGVMLRELPYNLIYTLAVALIIYVILLILLIKKAKKKNYA